MLAPRRGAANDKGLSSLHRGNAATQQCGSATTLQVCRLTSQHASTAEWTQSSHCNRCQTADWLWRQARRIAHRANRPQGTTNRAPPKTTASHFRRMRDGPTHFHASRTSAHHRKSPIAYSSGIIPHVFPSRTRARPTRSRRPFHHGNSRTAHTHSHIVHAYSHMLPYHMGHAHSHMHTA